MDFASKLLEWVLDQLPVSQISNESWCDSLWTVHWLNHAPLSIEEDGKSTSLVSIQKLGYVVEEGENQTGAKPSTGLGLNFWKYGRDWFWKCFLLKNIIK